MNEHSTPLSQGLYFFLDQKVYSITLQAFLFLFGYVESFDILNLFTFSYIRTWNLSSQSFKVKININTKNSTKKYCN